MKKNQFILFFSIAMLFVACQKEVIVPNNSSNKRLNPEDSYSKSVSIQINSSEKFRLDGITIVDPIGRPRPSRPSSGGSK
jgi:hypothetical protein